MPVASSWYARNRIHCLILLMAGAWGPAGAQQTVADRLIAAGHWKQARAWVKAQPTSADQALINFLLSQIRFAFGDRSAPLPLAEKAVSLNGRVAKFHRQLAEAVGVQAQHASPFHQLFLARKFRREIDTAIELDPRDVLAQRDLLEFYLLAPAIAGGDSHKAAQTAERIGAIDVPEGYLAQARIAVFQKRTAEAEMLLREGAEARPPSYHAQIELARFYLDPEHLNRAAAEMAGRYALELDRSRIEAYKLLARLYAERAEWSLLDSILKEAAQQNPDDLAPYFYAAEELLGARREPARAEQYLRKYLTEAPEGNEPRAPEAGWKLGLALEAEGRTGEAMAEWRRSLEADPTSPAGRELKRVRALCAATYNAAPARGNQHTPPCVQF